MTKFQILTCALLSALIAFIPISAISVPRGVAFVPGVAGLLFLILSLAGTGEKPRVPRATLIGVAAIGGMALLSCLWSIAPDETWPKAMKMTLLLLSGTLLISAAQTADMECMKKSLWMIPMAVIIAGLLVVIELQAGSPFYRLLRDLPPGTSVSKAEYNRAMVILALMAFPAMAILRHYVRGVIAGVAMLGLLPAFLLTDSQSAQCAIVLGGMAMVLFPYRWAPAWRVMTLAIIALMVAAPFLCVWAFSHLAPAINDAPVLGNGAGYGGQRIEIWDYISRYLLERPYYGYGYEATRYVTHFDSHEVYQTGFTVLHPHNAVLQIWIEFGLIGIMLACGLMAGLIGMIKDLTPAQARIALPVLIGTLLVSTTAYGMWQAWWIGTLFAVAAVTILAVRMEPPKNQAA